MEGATCLVVLGGDVRFGIPILDVVEVIRVPGAYGPGAKVRYRGGEVEVADLPAHLGAGLGAGEGRLVVLKEPGRSALRVAGVEGIFDVPAGLKAPGGRWPVAGPLGAALRGVARRGPDIVYLLDAGAFVEAMREGPEQGVVESGSEETP